MSGNIPWADPEGRGQGGGGGPNPPGKSQVALCILRNTGMGTPREAVGPILSNCFSREVPTAVGEIR